MGDAIAGLPDGNNLHRRDWFDGPAPLRLENRSFRGLGLRLPAVKHPMGAERFLPHAVSTDGDADLLDVL